MSKNVSEEFKNLSKKIKQQTFKLEIIKGETKEPVIAKELNYRFDGEIFKTIMQELDITVKNFDINKLNNQRLTFQYGIFVKNEFEYVDMGEYFIPQKDTEDDKKKEKLTVTGYDKMINFMKPFNQSELKLNYPCKMKELASRMGEICGVELYSIDFFGADLIVTEDFFTVQELTYRDVLEKICQATLTTAFIKDNKLYFKHIDMEDVAQELDTSYLSNLIIEEKFGPVNALVLGRGDVEDNIESINQTSIEKNGKCEVRFDENEFVDDKREELIDLMEKQIDGLEYYSIEANNLGLMWLEPCDVLICKDRDNKEYKTIYLSANVKINTGISGSMTAGIPEFRTTEYKVTTKEMKKTLKVERLAKKNEGLIKDIIQETTENSEKLSKHEQTIDSMKDTISSVETKVETVESTANSASKKADSAEATANSAKESAENAVTQVETTTERLVEVEKSLDGITTTVSATVKKVETVEGKADSAQQTADTANTNAQNAQKTADNVSKEIVTTNERVAKAEQTLDGFSQTVSAVQETLETTNAKFDNLAIGGTNLVSNLESNWEQGTLGENASAGSTYDFMKSDNTSDYHVKRMRIKELIPIKNEFVISFASGYKCCFALFDSSQKYLGQSVGFVDWFTSSPNIFNKNASYIALVLAKADDSVITPSEISKIKVKLELGNKPTDWSESPEDINQKFSNYSTTTEMNSAITQKANEITSKVSETYSTKTETTQAKNDAISSANSSADNKLKNYTNTTGMNSAIDKAKKEAEGNANNYTDGKLVNYSTTTQMNSAIKQSADSITSSVEKTITEKIDNIQVGGTNLVSNLPINWEQGSFTESSNAGSTYAQMKTTVGSSIHHVNRIRIKELIPIDSQFVISFDASNYMCCFCLFDGNKQYMGVNTGFYSWFNGVPGIFNKNASYIALALKKKDDSAITPSEISKVKIKLENGNKATDWTPAPEDTESKFENYYTKIETNSQIDQKSNQITSTVQQNITTAIDGIVIGGENLVSSLEANWEQGTLGEGAPTGSAYSSVKTSNGATNRIRTKDIIPIDSKFIVSFASGYRCCFVLFDSSQKYLGQSVGFVNWFTASPSTFDKNAKYIALCFSKSDGTSAISIKDVKDMKIKLELGTKSSGWSVAPQDYSSIVQKADSIEASVSTLDTNLNAKIDLKIDKSKLISEINASADQINLKAGRLLITSGNFILDKDGTVTAKNMKIDGGNITLYSEDGDVNPSIKIINPLQSSTYVEIRSTRLEGYGNGKLSTRFYFNLGVLSLYTSISDKNSVHSAGFSSYHDNSGETTVEVGNDTVITPSLQLYKSNYSNIVAISRGTDTIWFGTGSGIGMKSVLRGDEVRLYAHTNGAVYLGYSGSTAITSDETQKDIFEIDNKYIDFFNKLKPITYIYKNKGHRNHIGFGARQVENALLESGLTTEQFAGILKDEDVTISADEMGTEKDVHFDELYSLRYEEFIALNTLVIQNQQKEIEDLKKRLEILEKERTL